MLNKLAYYSQLSLITMVSYMPFWLIYLVSDVAFLPFYYLIRYRRKIVRKNLTECFPEKDLAEIKHIERKFYRFFIDMALESCKLKSISKKEIMRRMVFSGTDEINLLLSQGHSISAYLGHYGNWEWISSGRLWLYPGAEVAQIYHTLRNSAMDKIIRYMRERLGNVCVDMRETVRYMAKMKHEGKTTIIGFIADQSPKRRESKHFIQFLNHQTPVLTGTEKATKHYGYKAAFISIKRIKRGYYNCEFSVLHPNPQELSDFELTTLFFNRLEQEIHQQPELYLWTHNRFKYAKTE